MFSKVRSLTQPLKDLCVLFGKGIFQYLQWSNVSSSGIFHWRLFFFQHVYSYISKNMSLLMSNPNPFCQWCLRKGSHQFFALIVGHCHRRSPPKKTTVSSTSSSQKNETEIPWSKMDVHFSGIYRPTKFYVADKKSSSSKNVIFQISTIVCRDNACYLDLFLPLLYLIKSSLY